MTEEERRKEKSVCPKCGKENPEDAVFCNSCGAKLLVAGKGGFEGLISLHVVAVLYTFLSVAFNELVRVAPFLSLYLATGVLGLIVIYALAAGKAKGWTKFVSVAMIATGLTGSFLLFLIGLTRLRGIISPDWVIFIVTGALLWKDRQSL